MPAAASANHPVTTNIAGMDTSRMLRGAWGGIDASRLHREILSEMDTSRMLREAFAGVDTTNMVRDMLEDIRPETLADLRELAERDREEIPVDQVSPSSSVGRAAAALFIVMALVYLLPTLAVAARGVAITAAEATDFGLEMATALYEHYPELRGALLIVGTAATIKALRNGRKP